MTRRQDHYRGILPLLAVLLVLAMLASIRWGAVPISLHDMGTAIAGALGNRDALTLDERIFLEIRLPRALLSVLVGSSLAVGGVLMQGLFRNPIVEPGLVGTSSGAALGAALYFVLGATFKLDLGSWTLPVAAAAGGMLATWIVFRLSGAHAVGGTSEAKRAVVVLLGRRDRRRRLPARLAGAAPDRHRDQRPLPERRRVPLLSRP